MPPAPAQLLTIHQTGQHAPTSTSPVLSPLTSWVLTEERERQRWATSDFRRSRSSPPATQTDASLIDNPEYLSQLLKDKRQLAAVPNVFIHLERLLDQGSSSHRSSTFSISRFLSEINKVRVNLFNLSTRPKMELPEPTGEKKIFQDKVFIPVQQHPEVSSLVCVRLGDWTATFCLLVSFLSPLIWPQTSGDPRSLTNTPLANPQQFDWAARRCSSSLPICVYVL